MTKYCKLSKRTIQKITNLLQNTLRCSDRDKKCFTLSEKCSCETEVPEPAVKFRCFALAVLSSAKLPFQRWHLVPSARLAQQAAVLGVPVPGRARLGLLPVSGTAGAQRGCLAFGVLYTPRHFHRAAFLHKVFLFPACGAHTTAGIPTHREPGSALTSSQKASAMPVLPHEGHDAGGGPSQFEEGVSQQFLCRGSLRGLPHQHRVQEAPEDRGDLEHHTGIRGGQKQPLPAMLALCMLLSWEGRGHSDLPYCNSCAELKGWGSLLCH